MKISIKKAFKYAFDPNYRFLIGAYAGKYDDMSDEEYLQKLFVARLGYPLSLENPKTFNEKLQWLKLYDHNPLYTTMVDKYAVKQYVSSIIGDEYVIPTIGLWEKPNEIQMNQLPSRFVLKVTHDSGGIIICKNKTEFDFEKSRSVLQKSLERDFYLIQREWPYKNVPKRIIGEEYMEDMETGELRDYKFFCFNGVVKFFKVDFDRFIEHRANYYDKELKLLPFGEKDYPPNPNKKIKIPARINEMIHLAERLAGEIPFVRVDFYYCNDRIYFGEITFFPASGLGRFTPLEWDRKLGDLLSLPEIKEERQKI